MIIMKMKATDLMILRNGDFGTGSFLLSVKASISWNFLSLSSSIFFQLAPAFLLMRIGNSTSEQGRLSGNVNVARFSDNSFMADLASLPLPLRSVPFPAMFLSKYTSGRLFSKSNEIQQQQYRSTMKARPGTTVKSN